MQLFAWKSVSNDVILAVLCKGETNVLANYYVRNKPKACPMTKSIVKIRKRE